MLPLLFALLLSLQCVAGDNLLPRTARQHSSAVLPHVLSQLLVSPNPKFVLRDNGDGCANGWREFVFLLPGDAKISSDVCPNFPDECAPDGSFCVWSFVMCRTLQLMKPSSVTKQATARTTPPSVCFQALYSLHQY